MRDNNNVHYDNNNVLAYNKVHVYRDDNNDIVCDYNRVCVMIIMCVMCDDDDNNNYV